MGAMMPKGLTKNDLVKIFFVKPFLGLVYKVNCLKKPDEKLVVFADDRTNGLSQNFQQVKKAFENQGDYKFISLVADNRSKPLTTRVKEMAKAVKIMAHAKYIIVEDYYFPLYCFKKRPETKCAQVWHGSGALKKAGYSVISSEGGTTPQQAKWLPFHTNYDLVSISDEKITWVYAESFNMIGQEDKILPLGVARSDLFFCEDYVNMCKEKFLDIMPQSKGKKMLLYAPTYRGTVNKPDTSFHLPVKELYENFKDEYVLAIKLHPFIGENVTIDEKYSDFAHVFPTTMTVNELLPVADVLITDYSSSVFEYSLFGRPMVFFAYDKSDYDGFKGFYYKYEALVPGPICQTGEELVEALKGIDFESAKQTAEEFRLKYMSACNGKCSENIVKELTKQE